MSTTSASLPRARRSPRTFAKPTLWLIAALAGISVLLYTEYPLFFNHPRNPHGTLLLREWFILFPHALAKVYVVCICVAAPLVIVLSLPAPPLMRFAGEITGPLWLLCTLAAFLTARNRQIQAHRQWMIRSYAFTLNFIIARVLNPLPAYAGMSDDAFAMTLMFFAILYLFIPDIYFSWRELTTKRRT
jgi:hypothetical protein